MQPTTIVFNGINLTTKNLKIINQLEVLAEEYSFESKIKSITCEKLNIKIFANINNVITEKDIERMYEFSIKADEIVRNNPI